MQQAKRDLNWAGKNVQDSQNKVKNFENQFLMEVQFRRFKEPFKSNFTLKFDLELPQTFDQRGNLTGQ